MASDPGDVFDEDRLLASARRIAGSDDLGEEPFLDPLRALLDSLRSASLNDMGRMIWRGTLLKSLSQRARAERWWHEHPEILEEPIRAPIVVVGMMRSGTTLLQRALASDPRLTCAYGWEVGEPAPRPGWDPTAPDPRVADAEDREEQVRTFAPELFAIHPTYVHEAEEEIVFLGDAFLSHIPEASCDVPAYRSWVDEQDFAPAYRWLRLMLQLLQWQKRRRGEPLRPFVLKTPSHLGYLDVLLAEFPDAHIVHSHRDPVDVITSGASLNATLWRMHCDDVDPDEVGRQWLERMGWSCDRALAARARIPAERITDVRFSDAVADPPATVERILAAVDLPATDASREALGAWLDHDRRREALPVHRYQPADFGLSPEGIRKRFADYSDAFLQPTS
ncbi:sulfotransferase family protein [Dermatobacter hominis]|uniref:sulfotransferase family protein n=1 Tax=Dermatobacter hominis TaxID=2884263 RepID=UPI001D128A75|nr:sulfotransferase [Dermatobacter hominis]UDY34995.1 sulfotransferase [Dermatobacter hominis]